MAAPVAAAPGAFEFVPLSVNPESQGVHSGHAVAIVLCINSVLAALGVGVWVCWARKLELFQPVRGVPPASALSYFRAPHSTASQRPGADAGWRQHLRKKLQGLVRRLFSSSPLVATARRSGRDVAVYLAFMRMMVVIAGFSCTLALTVFAPVHFSSPDNATVDEDVDTNAYFVRGTVSSVQRSPGVLAAHVCGIYALAGFVVVCLYSFVGVVRDICAAGVHRSAVHRLSRRTVRVKGIPADAGPGAAARVYTAFCDAYPGKTQAVYVGYDVRRRLRLQRSLEKCLLRLKYKEQSEIPSATEIAKLRERCRDLKEEAEEWRFAVSESPESLQCAGFAHVIMRDDATARRALRARAITVGENRLSIHVAHHPGDIDWSAVEMERKRTVFRRMAVRAVLLLGLIFLSTPSAILTAFQEGARKIAWLREASAEMTTLSKSKVGAVVFQYLPVLAFLIISLVLPCVIEWISKAEPHASRFKLRQVVQRRFYVYLVLCTFVLPSIALSTVSAIIYAFSNDTVNNRDVLHSLVSHSLEHMFLPDSGAFFVNYIQVLATLGNLYELWRPLELFSFLRQSFFPRVDEKDRWTEVEEFEFQWQYPVALVVFTISFNFTVFIPVVTVFFLAFAAARFTIHCWHTQALLYANRDALDQMQMGKGVKSVCGLVHLSMMVSQFFVCCFFLFKVTDLRLLPHLLASMLLFAALSAHYAAWGKIPSAAYAQHCVDGSDPFVATCFGRLLKRGLARSSSEQLLHTSEEAESPFVSESLSHLYATPFTQHLAQFSFREGAGSPREMDAELVGVGDDADDESHHDGDSVPALNLTLDSDLFDSDASSLCSD
eukprot:TRINITY_DN2083_c0_g2_i1.p1 TRINITY_DN2083_c0_g2~~TRINITY_DN2083_c0_g2_i1.p1  ORF type:complete len:833 (+),score=232.90 TRINITY_DN2083_c0_g2_i1:102-2600(+)